MVYVHAGARAAGALPVPDREGRVQFGATARQERGVEAAAFDVVRDRAAFQPGEPKPTHRMTTVTAN